MILLLLLPLFLILAVVRLYQLPIQLKSGAIRFRTCLVSLNQTLQMQWMRSSGHGTKSLSERHQPGTV
jgi:hypothetical protein